MTDPHTTQNQRRTAPPSWAELTRQPVALFLDVDGTLVDFEEHPDLVRATEGLVSLLEAVADRLGGALALISGRPLSELDRIFAPWRALGAGVHGSEVRDRDGVHRWPADRVALDRLRPHLQELADRYSGAWLEDKGTSLAVHLRAAPEAIAAVDRALSDLVLEEPTMGVLLGESVVEVRPKAHDKGTAVDHLLATSPFSGRVPVVVGDDITDEDAFRVALRRGGLAVIAGSRRPTTARYRLGGPAAVRGWLTELVEEVRP